MANSDDEDAFLYGSDNEYDQKSQQPVTKKVKFADEVKISEKQTTPETDKNNNNKNNSDDDGEEEDEEYLDESDSDDDIDIIIGDSQPTPSKSTTSTSIPSDTLSELNDTDASSSSDKKPQQQRTTVTSSNIDVDKVPEYQDKPLTQLDIELLKLKPWRAPGVDVSDYFNFGFDEFTWIYYCHKQDKLRGEFNPSKVMESIMKGTGESNDAKPGAGGMPPFMPNMPNMPMPPPSFMANMPMPPMGIPMPPPGFNGQFPQPYNMPPNPNQQ